MAGLVHHVLWERTQLLLGRRVILFVLVVILEHGRRFLVHRPALTVNNVMLELIHSCFVPALLRPVKAVLLERGHR